jgi:hypothetical protein
MSYGEGNFAAIFGLAGRLIERIDNRINASGVILPGYARAIFPLSGPENFLYHEGYINTIACKNRYFFALLIFISFAQAMQTIILIPLTGK